MSGDGERGAHAMSGSGQVGRVQLARPIAWQDAGTNRNWCWAVGLAGLLAYYGAEEDLPTLVRRTYPNGEDTPATPQQFKANISQRIVKGGRLLLKDVPGVVAGEDLPTHVREAMWFELAKDRPVVVSTNGVHMRIVTALYRDAGGVIAGADISDNRDTVRVGPEFFVGFVGSKVEAKDRRISGVWVVQLVEA